MSEVGDDETDEAMLLVEDEYLRVEDGGVRYEYGYEGGAIGLSGSVIAAEQGQERFDGPDSPPPANDRIAQVKNERRYRLMLTHEFHPSCQSSFSYFSPLLFTDSTNYLFVCSDSTTLVSHCHSARRCWISLEAPRRLRDALQLVQPHQDVWSAGQGISFAAWLRASHYREPETRQAKCCSERHGRDCRALAREQQSFVRLLCPYFNL